MWGFLSIAVVDAVKTKHAMRCLLTRQQRVACAATVSDVIAQSRKLGIGGIQRPYWSANAFIALITKRNTTPEPKPIGERSASLLFRLMVALVFAVVKTASSFSLSTTRMAVAANTSFLLEALRDSWIGSSSMITRRAFAFSAITAIRPLGSMALVRTHLVFLAELLK